MPLLWFFPPWAVTMPDLPATRDALAHVTQICGNAVQWLDLPFRTFEGKVVSDEVVVAEMRADIQAARAQLDRAEAALNGTEGV